MRTEVYLCGPPLQWVDEVEYLGLHLSKEGFLGKNTKEVGQNCKSALHMLTNEDCFTLDIEPKHIVHELKSKFRSQMEYRAELLTYKARQRFVDADLRVVNMFITKLLILGTDRSLHLKHQLRIQLALGIPSFEITVKKAGRKKGSYLDTTLHCLQQRRHLQIEQITPVHPQSMP